MPRRRATEPDLVDVVLPGLDPDPEPRRRGRPPKAAAATGARRAPLKGPDGKITSIKALKDQVATEMYGVASLLVNVWGMRDPCADVFSDKIDIPGGGSTDRLGAIVAQTVEILGRNEKVLQGMANAGLLGQAGVLAGLLMPVVRTVWQAHGPGGHRHGDLPETAVDYDRYSAPAVA